jgi:hypothetical protein
MPVDGKGDGCVTQHAEVESIVCVLPDVLSADDDPLCDGLLKSRMKLVAKTGMQNWGDAGSAVKQRRKHSIRASFAGENQVLVERRLQCARVGCSQDGCGRLDVIRNAHARLSLIGVSEAAVKILTQAQVE